MGGAKSMTHLKSFCIAHQWHYLTPVESIMSLVVGEGELQKVNVISGVKKLLLFHFPNNGLALVI